jgi:hypothetical protein
MLENYKSGSIAQQPRPFGGITQIYGKKSKVLFRPAWTKIANRPYTLRRGTFRAEKPAKVHE